MNLQHSKYYENFLNICMEVKVEEVFMGRRAVWGALMCLAYYFLVESGRLIGTSKRRKIESK